MFSCAEKQKIAKAVEDAIRFFAPDIVVLPFPAWDCLPYDRVSPKSDLVSLRLATLASFDRLSAIAVHDRHHVHLPD